jgi:lysophospholipase L1-like esterase
MKILLAGDSWGTRPKIPHNNVQLYTSYMGLEDFIKNDKHEVVNVSKSGIWNLKIIEKIESALKQSNFDYVIFIQTDPLRDQKHCKSYLPIFEIENEKWFEDYDDLIQIKKQHLNEAYKRLNDLNKTIYLIGGCSKIDTEILSKYSNLICAIPSIPEFLQSGYTMPDIWGMSKWQKKIDKRWSVETLDKLIEQLKLTEWLHTNCPHFFTDPFHPDSEGYQKVYEYLKKILGLDHVHT